MLGVISVNYIEKVLNIKVQVKNWHLENKLPYSILDRFVVKLAQLDRVQALFLYPKLDLDQLATLKKQLLIIQQIEKLPVVLVLENITRSRREYLIASRIPFVVENKQIYLPFMGIALKEKFDSEVKFAEHLQPSTQVFFFYFMNLNKKSVYISEATKALPFSAMSISRAVKELVQTGLFEIEKEGVHNVLISKHSGYQLYNEMQPYLISPIRKIIYVRNSADVSDLCLAGLSALAKRSMINSDKGFTYAVNKIEKDWDIYDELIDTDTQVKIEVWKYDPKILSENGLVDPYSLAVSLKDDHDERVEEAVEDMLKKILEG